MWQNLTNKLSTAFLVLEGAVFSAIARLQFALLGIRCGKGLDVGGIITITNRGLISVGSNVRINSNSRRNLAGRGGRTRIVAANGAVVQLGTRVGISDCTIFARVRIEILDDTLIGTGCEIYDNDFHAIDSTQRGARDERVKAAPVVIGPRAFVGSRTIILKGVTIGADAVIGAGSVVTRDVPNSEIWAGNPAKFIRRVRS